MQRGYLKDDRGRDWSDTRTAAAIATACARMGATDDARGPWVAYCGVSDFFNPRTGRTLDGVLVSEVNDELKGKVKP